MQIHAVLADSMPPSAFAAHVVQPEVRPVLKHLAHVIQAVVVLLILTGLEGPHFEVDPQ